MAFESDPSQPLDEQAQQLLERLEDAFALDSRHGRVIKAIGNNASTDEEAMPSDEPEAPTDGGEEPQRRSRSVMGVVGLAAVVSAASIAGVIDNRGGTGSEQSKYLAKDTAVVTAIDDVAILRDLAVCRPEMQAQTEYMDYQSSQGMSGTGAPEIRAALARALSSPDTATIPCVAPDVAQSQFMLPVSSAGATSVVMESDIVGPFSVGNWCVTDKTHLDATAVRIGNAMMATAAPTACTDTALPVPVNSLPGVVPPSMHP
jgi:hypothetical protein